MLFDKMYEIHDDLWGTSKTARFILHYPTDDKLWAKRTFIYDLMYRFEDHYDESSYECITKDF